MWKYEDVKINAFGGLIDKPRAFYNPGGIKYESKIKHKIFYNTPAGGLNVNPG